MDIGLIYFVFSLIYMAKKTYTRTKEEEKNTICINNIDDQ